MKSRLYIVIILLASIGIASCSSGIRMPKHRKRSHCDCPTFSLNGASTPENTTTALITAKDEEAL